MSTLFVFAAGGTGGHLFPGWAVAERLRERMPDAGILFLGSERLADQEWMARSRFEFRALPSAPWGWGVRQASRWTGRAWAAYRVVRKWFRERRPDVVVGCGGFASVVPVLTARRCGVPVVLLEQNVIPGRGTRLLSRMRSDVCLSYAQTQTQLPRQAAVTVTGNPVRSSIARLAGERRTARLEEESPVLLVLGGSQGARRLNDLLLHLAASQRELLLGWRVRHQTGAADVMRVMAGYRDCGLDAEVQPFFDDMADVYRGAGLVVCRAGGTTLAELACAGLPAVLIPYPRAVADHQTHNARVFVRGGAAVLLPEGDVAPMAEALAGHVRRLRPETDAHHAMSHAMRSLAIPDAADTVASLVLARAAHVDPSFSTER